MKNFLLLSITMFSLFTINKSSAQVTFGRYGGQGQECSSGRGVCSFKSINAGNAISVTRGTEEKAIVFNFSKKDISQGDQIAIYGKPFSEIKQNERIAFVQENDLRIDEEILRELKIPEKINTIKQGNYPIIITDNQVQIIFLLTESN